MFKDNLKYYRVFAGYKNAKDFAALINIPYTTYMGYENKGNWPSEETIVKIAKALNVSLDQLVGINTQPKEIQLRECISSLRENWVMFDNLPAEKKVIIPIPRPAKPNGDFPTLKVPYDTLIEIVQTTKNLTNYIFMEAISNQFKFQFYETLVLHLLRDEEKPQRKNELLNMYSLVLQLRKTYPIFEKRIDPNKMKK